MQTSVNLQGLYHYSYIPLISCGIIMTILIVFMIVKREKNNNILINTNDNKQLKEKNTKNIPAIKQKYVKQLEYIEYEFKNNKISLRKAYQKISETIRLFVFEVTDIKTQNYSLNEIKKLNMPVLYDLIKEYYEPEFSFKPIGDFESSITKARSVIEKWN